MKPAKHLLLLLLYSSVMVLASCWLKDDTSKSSEQSTFSPSQHYSTASIIFGDDSFELSDSLTVLFQRKKNGLFDIALPYTPDGDSLRLQSIDLRAWMPLIPVWVQEDKFLTKAGVINQANRQHQVEFAPSSFELTGSNTPTLHHVDILHHCLYEDAWEVICYDQSQKINFHLKFPFPTDLFADLFSEKNKLPFEDFKHLINSKQSLKNTPIILSLLRQVQSKEVLPFQKIDTLRLDRDQQQQADFFSELVPNFSCLPPTVLNKQPEVLVRKVEKRNIITEGAHECLELEIQLLSNRIDGRNKIIAGGLDNIPTLEDEDAAKGLLVPIGLYSPPCYESYDEILIRTQKGTHQPYAFFINPQKRWLDHQELGIDALILYYDQAEEEVLHIKLLSLKRMLEIGHYTVFSDI